MNPVGLARKQDLPEIRIPICVESSIATHQIALTQPSLPLTPSTPMYRFVPSCQTISSTSVPGPWGSGGTPRPFTSSFRKLRTSTQSAMDSSTSADAVGDGRGMAAKVKGGSALFDGFEPEKTRLGVAFPA